jgi:hypothetical protein
MITQRQRRQTRLAQVQWIGTSRDLLRHGGGLDPKSASSPTRGSACNPYLAADHPPQVAQWRVIRSRLLFRSS